VLCHPSPSRRRQDRSRAYDVSISVEINADGEVLSAGEQDEESIDRIEGEHPLACVVIG